MMEDRRIDDDELPERVEIRLPPSLIRSLLETYPAEEFPEYENLQDTIKRALGDAIRASESSDD